NPFPPRERPDDGEIRGSEASREPHLQSLVRDRANPHRGQAEVRHRPGVGGLAIGGLAIGGLAIGGVPVRGVPVGGVPVGRLRKVGGLPVLGLAVGRLAFGGASARSIHDG
ncbi:MAG TPA: hypothetical protein VK858_02620, partial [Longimicrobiales bacterium]|nr:hypothetical protein [Longimicrobiales bacterium]